MNGNFELSESAIYRMHRDEYATLPVGAGANEAAIRDGFMPKKLEYFESRLYDIVDGYRESLLKDLPDLHRRKVNGFSLTVKNALSEEIRRGLRRNLPADMLLKRLAHILKTNALLLEKSVFMYRFEADGDDSTCKACTQHDGKTGTAQEFERLEITPPLHPNCRCELELIVYGSDGEHMLWSEYWHDYFAPFRRIPNDVVDLFNQQMNANRERFRSADSFYDHLDAILWGALSGFISGNRQRARAMLDDPTLYNILNNLLGGILDMVKGAFFPEEPFSLQALMDAASTLMLLYGASKLGQAAVAVHNPSPAYALDYRNRIAGTLATEYTKGAGSKVPKLNDISQSKLQHEFKHASDFGVNGNWNKVNSEIFNKSINNHVNSVSNPINGTYRGTIQVTHYYDSATGVNVMVDSAGNFVGGWKLSAQQIMNLLKNGNVQ